MFALRSAALGLMLGVSTTSLGDVMTDAVVKRYPVEGTTMTAVLRSLSERSPLVERTGQRHYGVTRVAFEQSATFQEIPDGCELLSNDIDLKLEVVLPEWVDRDRAKPQLVRLWDKLEEDITQHEQRHVEIAQESHAEMREKLDRYITADTCDALRERVRSDLKTMIEEHRRRQLAFDEATLANRPNSP